MRSGVLKSLTQIAVWSSAVVITVFGIQPARAEEGQNPNNLQSVSVNAQDLLVQAGNTEIASLL